CRTARLRCGWRCTRDRGASRRRRPCSSPTSRGSSGSRRAGRCAREMRFQWAWLAPQIPLDLAARVGARCAGDAAAWMGPCAAEVEPRDRAPVLRAAQEGTKREQLVERRLAVEQMPAGQAVVRLQVDRRENLLAYDEPGQVGRVGGQGLDDALA